MHHNALMMMAAISVNGLARAGGSCDPQVVAYPGTSGIGPTAATTMAVGDHGAGPVLYLGGEFDSANGSPARKAARLNGANLTGVAAGVSPGHAGTAHVNVVCAIGDRVYFGGKFDRAGGLDSPHLAAWNGAGWEAVGSSAEVLTIVGFNDQLYYSKSGGSWNAGLLNLDNGPVHDAVVFNDGSGDRIVAIGDFKQSNGQSVRRVAWSVPSTLPAGQWTEIGGGAREGPVYDALVHTDAKGAQTLYIAGEFKRVGDTDALGLAAWDGEQWSIPGFVSGVVHSMAFFDDGSGEALYIGGVFGAVNGVTAFNIARLRNGVWEAIGFGAGGAVYSLAAIGAGPQRSLAVSGNFQHFDGVATQRFVRIVSCDNFSECPGDTNGDGAVDFADLNTVLAAYNQSQGGPDYNPAADIDSDGDVDFTDLNVVVSAFNQPC